MFVTLPALAISLPPGLAPALTSAGARYWSAFHLTFPHPWFIASVIEGSGDESICLSWAVASADDVVDRVENMERERLVGLVCMIPPQDSSTGQWTSREVASIWRARDPVDGNLTVVFRDRAGQDFAAGFRIESAEHFIDQQLVFALSQSGAKRS
ncbi:hypothetical protein [Paucibacter sp. Y2R2-4]|uniref:hypothetical protein n=1 Tax=Paucibacter sp. Y2R2-4 TaxID=2893553 RepID=UPI0021E41E77|nr:hypothetical protein [Paucibacter sp. Y2R2-4]MCV2350808.1 hypothetical protein [Paucibacter sp. Y2R2-4]